MRRSWNIALDTVLDIKHAFADRFGSEGLYGYDEGNCIAYWVNRLDDPVYSRILRELSINEHDGLVLLRYGIPRDVDGVFYYDAFDGLMSECRSVVIDVWNERIALAPFRKFMNINECRATSEERIRELLSHAEVVEFSDKLDGSMQSARFYDGRLVMAGSRAVDRSTSFRLDNGYNFIESHENYMDMLRDNPDLTFMFEYIFGDDPHVVDYSDREEGLYLTGIRDVRDGREFHYREVLGMAEKYGVMATTVETLDLDGALEKLKSADGMRREGYVMNIDGFRVKLKSDDYVKLSRIAWRFCDEEHILEAVREGCFDDISSKLPPATKTEAMEKAGKVYAFIEESNRMVTECLNEIRMLGLVERRDVMIWINDNLPPGLAGRVRNAYLGREVDHLRNVTVEDVFGKPDTDG